MKIHARLALPLLLVAAACNPANAIPAAEATVARFHQQYNQQQLDAIYGGTTASFKENTSRADFGKFAGAVRRKLGAEVGTARSGWNVQALAGGTFVTVTYDTRFEKGPGVETFRVRVSGKTGQLDGYNINSSTLITD